jgi:hypothetical protein
MGEIGEGTEPLWRDIHSKASRSMIGVESADELLPSAEGMNPVNSWGSFGVGVPSLDSGVPPSSRSFDLIFF